MLKLLLHKGLIMNKLICSVFAATLCLSAISATAGTSSNSKVSKMMDQNRDGMVTKDEYMTYHGKAYSKMKQSKGGVSNNDIEAGVKHGFYHNSMNDQPIGTTTGVSNNGSTDDTSVGEPINGTTTGTN
jgi:hypothetical protein